MKRTKMIARRRRLAIFLESIKRDRIVFVEVNISRDSPYFSFRGKLPQHPECPLPACWLTPRDTNIKPRILRNPQPEVARHYLCPIDAFYSRLVRIEERLESYFAFNPIKKSTAPRRR